MPKAQEAAKSISINKIIFFMDALYHKQKVRGLEGRKVGGSEGRQKQYKNLNQLPRAKDPRLPNHNLNLNRLPHPKGCAYPDCFGSQARFIAGISAS